MDRQTNRERKRKREREEAGILRERTLRERERERERSRSVREVCYSSHSSLSVSLPHLLTQCLTLSITHSLSHLNPKLVVDPWKHSLVCKSPSLRNIIRKQTQFVKKCEEK